MDIVEKDNDLYVRTRAGDIKITSEPTLHKCALCGVAVAGGQHAQHLVDALLADHRRVCEQRPVGVGDCVRWEYGTRNGPYARPENWAEGRLTRCDGHLAMISVARCGLGTRIGKEINFGLQGSVLRRIPRPGAGEQNVVWQYREAVPCRNPSCNVKVYPAPDRADLHGFCTVCTADTAPHISPLVPGDIVRWWPDSLDHLVCSDCIVIGPSSMQIVSHGPRWSSKYGLVGDEKHKPNGRLRWVGHVAMARGGQHEPAPPRCACGEDHPPCEAHARHTKQAGPLIDGLTVAECDSRWSHNRYRLEAGLPQRHTLTIAQIAAGRASWQARNHPRISTLVRERVAAGREAERNRVRVEVQDVD